MPIKAKVTRASARRMWAKRLMDIVVAATLLAVLMPLLAVIATMVKLTSRGPVLFTQPREGLHARPFNILKFRTLKVAESDITGVAQIRAGDTRLTRVGAFLRRTSLDELPQLVNILRGDMALVGPRPHVAGMQVNGVAYRQVVPFYGFRHNMRPGLTGWAQANGFRGETSDEATAVERIAHDVAYIQNHSLRLDLAIMLLTLRHEFLTGTGR